jgi:hydroxymethylpyrimidine/phosphomethylpyrimidine kinase
VKIALTIAGSDSGGGAGIQADLKTFHQHGVFGTSVITAITAQNTLGVRSWDPVRPGLVTQQLDAVADDLRPAAFKTGMLGSPQVVTAVAEALARHQLENYVLDPVMIATSGDRLIDDRTVALMTSRLMRRAVLVTPNLPEAAALVGSPVRNREEMEEAGEKLIEMGAGAALIKGGHLEGNELVDVLVTPEIVEGFLHPRIETKAGHGTGCTLSAAITARLALGESLREAVRKSIEFVRHAIAAAPGLGAGSGPLNHTVPADTPTDS